MLLRLITSELLIDCRPSGLLIWCRCSCSQLSPCYGIVACSRYGVDASDPKWALPMVLLLWVPNRILIWFPGGHLLWCRCFWSQVGSCCGILASGPMCALDMVLLLLVPSGLLRPLRLVPSELPIWCRCFWPECALGYGVVASVPK